MKTLITFAVAIFLANIAYSQNQLLLEYDLYSDEIQYFRNGEQLDIPYVKVGENIKVIIKEFNPYITTAHVKVDQYNYSQQSFAPLLGSGGAYVNSGMGGIASLLGGFNSGAQAQAAAQQAAGARGASKETMQAMTQYQELISELSTVESRINGAYEHLNLFNNVQKSTELALADITSLKRNPNIKPSRVKELIQEELRFAFAKKDNQDIDITDLVDPNAKKEELLQAIDSYKDAISSYQELGVKMKSFSHHLQRISGSTEDPQLENVKTSTEKIIKKMNDSNQKFNSISYDGLINSNLEGDVQTMAFLRQVNEEIKNNDFVYTFTPIQAEGDEVQLNVSFARATETGEYQYFKSLDQKIPVAGNWKVEAGLGIAFGVLAKETYDYKVIDNTIIADPSNDFIPSIATFIHVYKQNPSSINIGGSFGVGMPVLNAGSGASFFMGPTVSIGQKQRILLTAGIMGTQANRLAFGLDDGDFFSADVSFLPFEDKYEFGYFMGLSFSVLK